MRKKTDLQHMVVEFLSTRQEIEFAYIFGSFASGEKYHDIDIAVYLNQASCLSDHATYPYGYESDLLGKLTALLRTDAVDFVVLNKASLTLFTRVIKYGKVVIDRDRLRRIHIENNIRKQFIDTAYLRVMRDRSIANTIAKRHV